METTLYELLNIPLNADPSTIDSAYLERIRRVLHSVEPSEAAAELLQLTHAYSVLADADRRAVYDHALSSMAIARDGYDATYQVALTVAEAHQGATRTLSFHRPDGTSYDVVVSIPPGCRHGDRIRLSGRGGPSLDTLRRGDLVVELIVRGY